MPVIERLSINQRAICHQLLQEVGNSFRIEKDLNSPFRLIRQSDLEARNKESLAFQPFSYEILGKDPIGKDVGIGQEHNFGARTVRFFHLPKRRDSFSPPKFLDMTKTVTKDLHNKFFAQGVHHRHSYAVEPACHLVRVVIKFSACVKVAENGLHRVLAGGRVFFHGDAPSLVFNRDTSVCAQDHVDESTVAVERLVHAVVQNFPYRAGANLPGQFHRCTFRAACVPPPAPSAPGYLLLYKNHSLNLAFALLSRATSRIPAQILFPAVARFLIGISLTGTLLSLPFLGFIRK